MPDQRLSRCPADGTDRRCHPPVCPAAAARSAGGGGITGSSSGEPSGPVPAFPAASSGLTPGFGEARLYRASPGFGWRPGFVRCSPLCQGYPASFGRFQLRRGWPARSRLRRGSVRASTGLGPGWSGPPPGSVRASTGLRPAWSGSQSGSGLVRALGGPCPGLGWALSGPRRGLGWACPGLVGSSFWARPSGPSGRAPSASVAGHSAGGFRRGAGDGRWVACDTWCVS